MTNLIATAVAVCVFSLSATTVASDSCGASLPEKHNWKTKLTFSRGDGKPDRTYHVFAPAKYNRSIRSKVVLFFHGWGESGLEYLSHKSYEIKKHAERYNYVFVALDGLPDTPESKYYDPSTEYRSWTHPGSSDGIGMNGDVTTCDLTQDEPDYCYKSQCDCKNRCGWTQCLDDDVQMVQDFILGGDGFEGSLKDVVCRDPKATFASGVSNGGMFVWNLGWDPRTAPLLSGIAPIIGLPHCDYDIAGDVPVLLQVGDHDETVTPHNGIYPGNPSDVCVTNTDGDGYIFISGHRITTTWAKGHPKCEVTDGNAFPTTEYKFEAVPESANHRCRTWCKGRRPHSVDCTFKGGHDSPSFTYQAALIFFDRHLPKAKRSDCKDFLTKNTCKKTSCEWKQSAKKNKCRRPYTADSSYYYSYYNDYDTSFPMELSTNSEVS